MATEQRAGYIARRSAMGWWFTSNPGVMDAIAKAGRRLAAMRPWQDADDWQQEAILWLATRGDLRGETPETLRRLAVAALSGRKAPADQPTDAVALASGIGVDERKVMW